MSSRDWACRREFTINWRACHGLGIPPALVLRWLRTAQFLSSAAIDIPQKILFLIPRPNDREDDHEAHFPMAA
jgi:hypothetical protein